MEMLYRFEIYPDMAARLAEVSLMTCWMVMPLVEESKAAASTDEELQEGRHQTYAAS